MTGTVNMDSPIRYSYVSHLPADQSWGSPSVKISQENGTFEELLESLKANSNIKDENGKVISFISEINYEIK